jgi:hypothetical protein
MSSAKEPTAARLPSIDEYPVKTIELLPCRYRKECRAQNCKRTATIIARSFDSGGRPIRQYELCQQHADQVVEREKAKGREIVTRE